MYSRRFFRRRQRFIYLDPSFEPSETKKGNGRRLFFLSFAAFLLLFVASAFIFLNDISSQIALSDACDIVTIKVNRTIAEIFEEKNFDADWFVSFEKSESGEVCAVNCNMSRINSLSAEILSRTVDSTANNTIIVSIPIGNLTGISLLMGRGPKIPVKILMLTSSRVEFNNNLTSAGINQTKHQINIDVIVDVDVLLPWGTESSQVSTEVMIADTVIVGDVPQTLFDMQK